MTITLTSGCASLNPVDMAVDAIIPDQEAGLQVDTQFGDNEYALGNQLEVETEKMNNVIGRDEVKNDAQVINQTNVPTSWFVVGTLSFFLMTAVAIIGWMMPVPKWCRRE